MKFMDHTYNEDTDFHHVDYCTLFHSFVLFRQGNSSNSEYKQKFIEKLEIIKAYNKGGTFGNSPGLTLLVIKLLGFDANAK